jgi:hypothetical protein
MLLALNSTGEKIWFRSFRPLVGDSGLVITVLLSASIQQVIFAGNLGKSLW